MPRGRAPLRASARPEFRLRSMPPPCAPRRTRAWSAPTATRTSPPRRTFRTPRSWPRGLRQLPPRPTGAVRREPARHGRQARRPHRAFVQDLPRDARRPAPLQPQLAHHHHGRAPALRAMPSARARRSRSPTTFRRTTSWGTTWRASMARGCFSKGLVVTAVCTSCHTAHHVLPHTDPRSSIAKDKIAKTCTKCHARIERVHRKVIRGELWEKQPHMIPACVDCHQPHKVRKVFYTQGMADRDCMSCHANPTLKARRGATRCTSTSRTRRTRATRASPASSATPASCPPWTGPARPITRKVDCSVCHAEQVAQYNESTHGQLAAKGSPDAPGCRDCHGTHGVLGQDRVRTLPPSPATSRPCAASATARGRRRRCATRASRSTWSSTTRRASTARGCSKAG